MSFHHHLSPHFLFIIPGTITSSEGKVTVNLTFATAPAAGKEVSIRLSTDVTALGTALGQISVTAPC